MELISTLIQTLLLILSSLFIRLIQENMVETPAWNIKLNLLNDDYKYMWNDYDFDWAKRARIKFLNSVNRRRISRRII